MAAKKSSTKKTSAKKATAKKATAKKATAKKATAKKATAKKATAKKATAKKATAKKATAKKATAKKATGRAADRARVSSQAHELSYVAKKHGVTTDVVASAISRVGNLRKDVEAAIVSQKKRSRAADRAQVSQQPHETATLAQKFKVPAAKVLEVVKSIGRSRSKVQAALAQG